MIRQMLFDVLPKRVMEVNRYLTWSTTSNHMTVNLRDWHEFH